MGIEIKGVVCPQCGSHDVNILSDEQGQCNSCQAQFVIKAIPEIKESPEKSSDDLLVAVVNLKTKYTKDDFLRKCWISAVSYDTPLDLITSCDFSKPEEIERIVYSFWGDVTVNYTASSGHHRQEPYIEIEKYREKVGDEYVTRERPVTKYKTVTDWSPVSGKTTVHSWGCINTDSTDDFDHDLYEKSCRYHAEREEYTGVLTPAHIIDENTVAKSKNLLKTIGELDLHTNREIPGDEVKNVHKSAESVDNVGGVVSVVKEYVTHLKYEDEDVEVRAFPVNELLLSSFRIHGKNDTDEIINKKQSEIKPKRWETTKKITMISLAILCASVIASLFIRSYFVIIAAFIAAVGMFIYSRKYWDKIDTELNTKFRSERDELKHNVKAKLFEALNNKLASLGYEAAKPEEMNWGDR